MAFSSKYWKSFCGTGQVPPFLVSLLGKEMICVAGGGLGCEGREDSLMLWVSFPFLWNLAFSAACSVLGWGGCARSLVFISGLIHLLGKVEAVDPSDFNA